MNTQTHMHTRHLGICKTWYDMIFENAQRIRAYHCLISVYLFLFQFEKWKLNTLNTIVWYSFLFFSLLLFQAAEEHFSWCWEPWNAIYSFVRKRFHCILHPSLAVAFWARVVFNCKLFPRFRFLFSFLKKNSCCDRHNIVPYLHSMRSVF